MFNKILFLVFSAKEKDELIQQVLDMAKITNAQIIALHVIDFNLIRHLSAQLGKRESEVTVDLEEEGWMYLYYIEDKAKEKGVRISLIQEEGILESEVVKMASKHGADLVIISRHEHKTLGKITKLIESLLFKLSCPVYIL